MIMANTDNDTYLVTEAESENITDFLNPIYDLEERDIPKISSDSILTPIQSIKNKLKPYIVNNLTGFHINAGSIPKHYDEIVRLLHNTGVDFLAVSETFISEKTPKCFYEIPGEEN